MPFPLNDLRGHVFHGAYEAIGTLPIRHVALGQAKICDLDVTIAVQQHVLLQNRFSLLSLTLR